MCGYEEGLNVADLFIIIIVIIIIIIIIIICLVLQLSSITNNFKP